MSSCGICRKMRLSLASLNGRPHSLLAILTFLPRCSLTEASLCARHTCSHCKVHRAKSVEPFVQGR